MSIFGDIADAFTGAVGAVGDAVGGVENAISGIAQSGIVQGALDIGGSFFGDPGLGGQVAAGAKALDKIFGRGGPNAAPARALAAHTAARTTTGYGAQPRRARRGAAARGGAQLYRVNYGGHVYMLTGPQLSQFVTMLKTAAPIPVVKLSPPPPPPAQPVGTGAANSILANADAVAAAVAAGAKIQIGGQIIDTTKPIGLPPVMASVANDIAAATGLQVVTPRESPAPPPPGPGARRTTEI